MKDKVIVVVGPTAVGKTELSLKLAEELNGEIISGDSMQVYKTLDIGTAKATKKEQELIKHHLIDIIDVTEDFTVSDFQKYARTMIKDITARGKLPIIVGGSGLYIQSVLYDYQFPNEARNEEITKTLEAEVEKNGIESLYNKLRNIDPEQANKIHPNNHRRVIRAIEIFETTGLTMTEIQSRQKVTPLYDTTFIGLEMDRSLLYERINNRVDLMLEKGLVQEVEQLYNRVDKNNQALSGIGYKEFIPYFKGEQSLDQCIEILKRNSRRFAKRQSTWFKNQMTIPWYNVLPNNNGELYDTIMLELFKEKQ